MQRITEITRGYATAADRERAIAQLRRHGYDHFVRYRDTAAKHALCFGRQRVHKAPDSEPSFLVTGGDR